MNVDILDNDFWVSEQMWDTLRWLRENDPIHWDAKNEIWVATKYDDVATISKNPAIFCSGEGTRPNMPTKLSIIDMDEPRHGQLRKLINKGFTPRMVDKLEPYFRQLTTDAIDRVVDRGECDFVLAVSVPLPLELIAELIGIDKADRDTFHRWSDEMIAADGNYDNDEVMNKAAQAAAEYMEYLQDVLTDREVNPRDDLVSILVSAQQDGLLGSNADQIDAESKAKLENRDAMDIATDELVMFLVALLVAGNETTRNAISGGISALIENPEERQKLINDPGLLPLAAEEIVRYVSPVLNFARTATQDTELRGKQIKKGQKVLLVYPSANRDADVFDEPDRFKVDRDPNPHLGFGIGNHFCLGANLARMELRVAVEEVLRRMPEMQYTAGTPRMIPGTLVRSFASMPVRFDLETPTKRSAA